MRNIYIYIGAFVLFIFYTLFFTVETGEEYLFLPRGVLSGGTVNSGEFPEDGNKAGIEMAGFAGFVGVSEQGEDISFGFYPKEERVSVSSQSLIFYKKGEQNIKAVSGSDFSEKKFSSSGWPMQLAGRVFYYDAAGSSVEERDISGNLLWERDLNSFLTAVSATEDWLLFGTVDGDCFILDKSGREVLKYRPECDGFDVVAGGVLSQDGSKLALIYGTDPAKLEVFNLKIDADEGSFDLVSVFKKNLDFPVDRPLKMFIDRRDESLHLLFESEKGLEEVCLETFDLHSLHYFGRLSDWVTDPETKNRSFLSGIGGKGCLSVFTPEHKLLYREYFYSDFRSFSELSNYSFFSLDDNLLIVEKVYE